VNSFKNHINENLINGAIVIKQPISNGIEMMIIIQIINGEKENTREI
jgi:hypothetical protein